MADPEQPLPEYAVDTTDSDCAVRSLLQLYTDPALDLGLTDATPCLLTLYTAPANYSKALSLPREQRLFQHYLESTSAMLAVRGHRRNPFVTCLVPLAMAHDSIMHALLAISGSHYTSSLRDESLYDLGRQHYGVAIRSAKHQITQFGHGVCNQPLVLMALLLALCQFEVILAHDLSSDHAG